MSGGDMWVEWSCDGNYGTFNSNYHGTVKWRFNQDSLARCIIAMPTWMMGAKPTDDKGGDE